MFEDGNEVISYNYLDDRDMKTEYFDQMENGAMKKGTSSVEWDDDNIDITIKIPLCFSAERIFEVFQSLLNSVVEIVEYEGNKNKDD